MPDLSDAHAPRRRSEDASPYFYCDDADLAELIAKFGYVLLQQKKFREAAPVFERTLNSGFLPADRVDDRTKTVAQLYSTLGEHGKAVE